jgi:hypothetical protein
MSEFLLFDVFQLCFKGFFQLLISTASGRSFQRARGSQNNFPLFFINLFCFMTLVHTEKRTSLFPQAYPAFTLSFFEMLGGCI